MLAQSDHTKPFDIYTDTTDFAIDGVLMQEGHPIAFKSQKLNETKRRYTVQEKEMTAIVYYLRIWRNYLLGAQFVVMTDNATMSYFETKKESSPKLAWEEDLLTEFDYEYNLGKENVVMDALRLKVTLPSIGQVTSLLLGWIKEGLAQDQIAKTII